MDVLGYLYKPACNTQRCTLHTQRAVCSLCVSCGASRRTRAFSLLCWRELYNIAALSRPRPATRCLTAQAFDPTVLEALYFVLALVDDDHEAKDSAKLSKRRREAAPPRPAA